MSRKLKITRLRCSISIMFIPNFIRIGSLVQNLERGTHAAGLHTAVALLQKESELNGGSAQV